MKYMLVNPKLTTKLQRLFSETFEQDARSKIKVGTVLDAYNDSSDLVRLKITKFGHNYALIQGENTVFMYSASLKRLIKQLTQKYNYVEVV